MLKKVRDPVKHNLNGEWKQRTSVDVSELRKQIYITSYTKFHKICSAGTDESHAMRKIYEGLLTGRSRKLWKNIVEQGIYGFEIDPNWAHTA